MLNVVNAEKVREEAKKIKLEQMKAEVRRLKFIIRARKICSLVVLGATPITYSILRELALVSRGTSDLGGEIAVPILMLVSVAFIYPNFKVPAKYEYLAMSRTDHNHIDVDLNEDNGKKYDVYSENGAFDIIDSEGKHHMIKLFAE